MIQKATKTSYPTRVGQYAMPNSTVCSCVWRLVNDTDVNTDHPMSQHVWTVERVLHNGCECGLPNTGPALAVGMQLIDEAPVQWELFAKEAMDERTLRSPELERRYAGRVPAQVP